MTAVDPFDPRRSSVTSVPETEATEPRIRVLYVGGWGRSGSTLLDRMLGQIPGFCSLGEVREIWQSGLQQNRPCGCGVPFRSCPFWTDVGERAFGGWDRVDPARAWRLWWTFDRPWALPLLMAPARALPSMPKLNAYLRLLRRLYLAAARASGATVLIDSSKLVTHALLARRVPEVDLRFVHLIRDSRAVAFSWGKRIQDRATQGAPIYMERYSPASSAIRWLLYNEPARLMRSLGPYRLVRFEDLMADPRTEVRKLVQGIGGTAASPDLSFIGDGQVVLQTNHTVDGNPMRFAVGPVPLRPADEWEDGLSAAGRWSVTALTLPRLRSYGYPIRGEKGTRE